MRCNSLSWLKFWLCANEDNWMCPGHCTGVAIYSEYVVSLCRYWQHFNFHPSCCRLWIWNKETVLQIVPWVGSITASSEINISHIRYAAPCVAQDQARGATVGCQMMSLLIFYRLTQLFPDTQFKYLRWRRFKYQKQTRPANDEWQEERTTMIKTFYGFLVITLVQGVFAKIIEMFRANICFLQIFTK